MKSLALLVVFLPLLLVKGVGTSHAAPSVGVSGATPTGFVVSWDAVPGAQAYSIWVEPGSVNSGRLDPSTTSWTFSSGAASSSYTVKLDVLVNGTWATMATTTATTTAVPAPTPTPAPTPQPTTTSTSTTTPTTTKQRLKVMSVGASWFTVAWASVKGATGYSVSVQPGSLSSGLVTGTSYTFANLAPSTYYTVTLNVQSGGVWTTTAMTTTKTAAAPATPTPTPTPPTPTPTPSPTPAPTTAWTLQSPQAPITNVTNLSGLGLNVNNQLGGSYHDYVIDGTGDSAILLQGSTTGVSFARMRLLRVAAVSAVSWAKHGMYVKARGNTFTDIYAEEGGNAASGFSVRMGNNSFERTVIKGFPLAVTYYEHDGAAGTVTFKDGDWTFTGDTAVWGDDSNEPPSPYIKQAFVFENIDAHGPAGAKFLKFGSSAYVSGALAYQGAGVKIINCTINGRPVTAADIGGVASNLLSIQ